MSKNNNPKVSGKNEKSLVRSSAAEYLTFVAASGMGGVEAVYADETIWRPSTASRWSRPPARP